MGKLNFPIPFLFPIMSMCHDWPVQNDESVRGPEKGCWCYFADFSNRG